MNNPSVDSSSNFLKDYGTLIIAVYGVIQLWLVHIFKCLFRRRRIELFTAELIEVGYSNFGPTLSLFGTLRTLHRDSFISNVSLLLRRERDMAQHQFNWLAFRPSQFNIGPRANIAFELPSGFIITPTQPHRYNILFADFRQQSEMLPFTREIERIWTERTREVRSLSPTPDYIALFDTFARSGTREILDFHSNIQRLCYWERGDYSLEIRVIVENPRRNFLFRRRFSLTDEDVARLRINVIAILAELCRQPNNFFNFAYPRLLG